MLKFALKNQNARITSVNPRAELHGENPKPACDVSLQVLMTNNDLAEFHPMLKSLLYVKDGERPDLVSQAQQDDDHATMLRFPQMKVPFGWDGEHVGAEVIFHYGTTEKSHIKLDGCVVGKFKLEPLEGGSVGVNCQVQCHPDEKAFGKLCTLVGADLPVTITPPAEAQQGAAE